MASKTDTNRCRLCFALKPGTVSIFRYLKRGEKFQYSLQILEMFQIKMVDYPILPQTCCADCSLLLRKIEAFKVTVTKAQASLNNLLEMIAMGRSKIPDVDNLCRLCTRKHHGSANIFRDSANEETYHTVIAKAFKIQLKESFVLPAMCCSNCMILLKEMVSFRSCILKSHESFISLQSGIKVESKSYPDSHNQTNSSEKDSLKDDGDDHIPLDHKDNPSASNGHLEDDKGHDGKDIKFLDRAVSPPSASNDRIKVEESDGKDITSQDHAVDPFVNEDDIDDNDMDFGGLYEDFEESSNNEDQDQKDIIKDEACEDSVADNQDCEDSMKTDSESIAESIARSEPKKRASRKRKIRIDGQDNVAENKDNLVGLTDKGSSKSNSESLTDSIPQVEPKKKKKRNKKEEKSRPKRAHDEEEEKHLESIMRDMGVLKCTVCSQVEYGITELQSHMRSEHKQKAEIRCCDKIHKGAAGAFDHIRFHLNKDAFKCKYCGRQLTSYERLRSHELYCNPDRKRACDICGKEYTQEHLLNSHRQMHFPEEMREFSCPYCPRRFAYASQRRTHVKRLHERVDSLACPICQKGFPDRSSLTQHIKNHKKLKGRKIADKTLSKDKEPQIEQGDIVGHLSKDEKPKIEQCDICFKYYQHLYAHKYHSHPEFRSTRKTNSKDSSSKAVFCDKCGKKLADKISFEKHYKTSCNAGETNFKCETCNKVYKSRHALNVHASSHKPKTGWACPFCPFRGKREGCCYRHLKKFHPEEFEKLKDSRTGNSSDTA